MAYQDGLSVAFTLKTRDGDFCYIIFSPRLNIRQHWQNIAAVFGKGKRLGEAIAVNAVV